MNYLMNTYLQFYMDNTYSLKSSIHPMPKDDNEAGEFQALLALSAGFAISFFISFGMAFLTTMFIFFLIKEREVSVFLLYLCV